MCQAQSFEFYCPYLAGSKYNFAVNQGVQVDTILSGTVGMTGNASFKLPEKYKDYAGIVNCDLGEKGSLKIIMNHETFSIIGKDAGLSENTISFSNSKENDFFKTQMTKQQALFGKIQTIYNGLSAYADDDTLYPVFEKEFYKLKTTYAERQKEIAASPLYAAKYLLITNRMNGLGAELKAPSEMANQAQQIAEIKQFIEDEMDIDVLFTSGLWNTVISATFDMYPDKKDFGEAMVKCLKRVQSQKIFESFGNDLVTICEQFGWIDAENVIVPYLASSEKIQNPTGMLKLAMELDKIKPGTKAIPIVGLKGELKNTLLFFYESGCEHCIEQLKVLKPHYDEIKAQGIRVVSISSDTSEEVFKYHSADFPWPDKLCDYQGFDSVNFKNYGVVATPGIWLIDKNGKIVNRYTTILETGLIKE
jgi:peroxiredoxin